jgi:calpain
MGGENSKQSGYTNANTSNSFGYGGSANQGNEYTIAIKRKGANKQQDSNTTSTRKTTSMFNTGAQMNVKKESADDYLEILKPQKGESRMKFNPYLPKTLTPKGYAKLKLMMSVADKQYTNLVKRLKRDGKLWEDPDFPADDTSIGELPDVKGKVEWKRAKEIHPNAQFFVGGASRFDIEQGALGDCWLLAVVSSISSYPELFGHVIPKEQDMQGPDYVGVFRVRFWRFGQWVEVLVDDRLPVYRNTNRLVFMHSTDENEFWSALLEKGYAKLCGCYAHLSGGTQGEAMEDLTGGMVETLDLTPGKRPADLIEQMLKYSERCCLMGCSFDSAVIEQKFDNGLIGGHAYSLTGVKAVNFQGGKQYLVRCRNPWGGHYEWKGAWADNSPEWNQISASEKKALDLQFNDDGEFWMSYEDFVSNFTRLEVCHLGLESLESNQQIRGKRRLEEAIFAGAWEKNVNAGGCINNRATFWTNPQFRFTVTDPDPSDDENKCFAVVGVMQRDVRRKSGADFLTIGFMIYEAAEGQTALLTRAQLLTKRSVGKSTFSNSREVSAHFRLNPGTYVVIPSTFQPNLECQFIVRILTEVAVEDKELDEDNCNTGIPTDVIDAVKMEDTVFNEDEEIENKFNEMADPKSKSINATQLRELLNSSSLQDITGFQGFDREMCRTMVAAVDSNLTGALEQSEFMDLWTRAKCWKMIFLKHDVEQNGYFNADEFREALDSAGYHVSNRLFNALVHRYEDPDTNQMRFEDFMLCVMRLKNVFETTSAQAKNSEGAGLFSTDDYLRFGVYV